MHICPPRKYTLSPRMPAAQIRRNDEYGKAEAVAPSYVR